MSTELSREQWEEIRQALLAPFPMEAIEVLERSGKRFAYLDEQAIRQRLDSVCPGWGCALRPVDPKHAKAAFICSITIYGVTREDAGEWSNEAGGGMTDFVKAAATDSFKRAAQRWWVGNFLELLPKTGNLTPEHVRRACLKAGWTGPRPESGGDRNVAQSAPPVNVPAPGAPTHGDVCAYPGCSERLKPAQRVFALARYGEPRCPKHPGEKRSAV